MFLRVGLGGRGLREGEGESGGKGGEGGLRLLTWHLMFYEMR